MNVWQCYPCFVAILVLLLPVNSWQRVFNVQQKLSKLSKSRRMRVAANHRCKILNRPWNLKCTYGIHFSAALSWQIFDQSHIVKVTLHYQILQVPNAVKLSIRPKYALRTYFFKRHEVCLLSLHVELKLCIANICPCMHLNYRRTIVMLMWNQVCYLNILRDTHC